MPFNVNTTNEKSNIIDLCAILKGGQPFIFLVRFSGIESNSKLISELKLCAMKARFLLVLRSTVVHTSES